MSNIIHEIMPEGVANDENRSAVVSSTLARIGELLNPNGQLVILDGLRPDNDDIGMTVTFTNTEIDEMFEHFAQEYHGFPIEIKKLGEHTYSTRLKDLAAFLTKARYMNEEYWPIESTQIYQYFTASQFTETLQAKGLTTERLEPQEFDQIHLGRIFQRVEPTVVMPAKNVLIVARKPINPAH